MAKSILYSVNNLAQTVALGGGINFGNPVRRFGCNCNIMNGNPYVVGAGYYAIDTNFTLVAGAAGTAVITLYKDGDAIPGAIASVSVASGDSYTISIPAIIREYCQCDATISAVLTGVNGTVNNATIYIEKL